MAHPAIAILSLIVVGVMNKVSRRSSSSLRSSPLIYGTSKQGSVRRPSGWRDGVEPRFRWFDAAKMAVRPPYHRRAVEGRGQGVHAPAIDGKDRRGWCCRTAFSLIGRSIADQCPHFLPRDGEGEAAMAQEARRGLTEAGQWDALQLCGRLQDIAGPRTGRTSLPAPRRTAPPAASYPSTVRRPISIINSTSRDSAAARKLLRTKLVSARGCTARSPRP